jgi:hypothetical protein
VKYQFLVDVSFLVVPSQYLYLIFDLPLSLSNLASNLFVLLWKLLVPEGEVLNIFVCPFPVCLWFGQVVVPFLSVFGSDIEKATLAILVDFIRYFGPIVYLSIDLVFVDDCSKSFVILNCPYFEVIDCSTLTGDSDLPFFP